MKNGYNNAGSSKNSVYDALPQKKVLKFIIDTATLFFAYALASLLRFDFRPTPEQVLNVQNSLLLAVFIPTVVIYALRVNHGKWRYSSLADLMNLFGAFTAGWAGFVFVLYFLDSVFVPRTVLLMYWVLGMFSLSVTRAMPRILTKLRMYMLPDKRRTMVIGAGDAGEMIIRQMKNNPELGYYPVAIVDDSKKKINTKIHGVKVLGGISKLTEIAKTNRIDEIIIATPSARPTQMRRIVQLCEATGIEFKTVPGPREIVNGQVELNQIRKVKIDDLLDRRPVQIDWEKIREYANDKVVLITGAGGSIGSELSRQILKLNPKKLICLDRTENSLFYLEHELRQMHEQTDYQVCVADILDENKISSVLTKYRPHMVFHAAAYKHVPLMELHPEEAIRNNVIGTYKMMSLSEKFGVEKFVLISTDKAVNPSSIMGATKRTAELILQSYSSKTDMKLITVRFGNVLGSYGSVIPLFQKQISNGGPVTITHPDMKRFFMTIPEAVKLILESARMGQGNEIFVLDMGEPVKLLNIARRLISLSGYEPDKDIAIEIIGTRPGEKLEEELWNTGEVPMKTDHPKIMMALGNHFNHWDIMSQHIDVLSEYSQTYNIKGIYDKLMSIIPEYSPNRGNQISKPAKTTVKTPE